MIYDNEDFDDESMIDLGGGMVVPLRELLEDDDDDVAADTDTEDDYPERRPGFVLGYYEGWSDAKAGRQYGEGQHGQRSGIVPAADTDTQDET